MIRARIGGFEKGLAGEGWRLTGPKTQQMFIPRNVFPFSKGGGIGKRAQKRGLSVWHRKDRSPHAPSPSARQPLSKLMKRCSSMFSLKFSWEPPKIVLCPLVLQTFVLCASRFCAGGRELGAARSSGAAHQQHPKSENQDSQHMLNQPRGSFPEKRCRDRNFWRSYRATLVWMTPTHKPHALRPDLDPLSDPSST